MALGRQRDRQAEMLVTWSELPRSPGHVFYDRLQAILIAAGFDSFVEGLCASHYAVVRGRPSLPPGRYFRMLLIGYFEGIDSERGLEWRCADSLSLREFLRLAERETVPDHSWLSRTRSRLPLELHEQVFTWALHRLSEHGLIKGERIPTLDEVFSVTSGKCGLNIELKADGLEHQVAQIMQARGALGDSIVSSFDWEYLKKIKQLHFDIRIALLAEEKPVDLMMNAVAMRAHAINPRWDMVTADLCKAAHERGLKVYTWTVDADARMRALAECGVDGIMTNFPERLRTVVGG